MIHLDKNRLYFITMTPRKINDKIEIFYGETEEDAIDSANKKYWDEGYRITKTKPFYTKFIPGETENE